MQLGGGLEGRARFAAHRLIECLRIAGKPGLGKHGLQSPAQMLDLEDADRVKLGGLQTRGGLAPDQEGVPSIAQRQRGQSDALPRPRQILVAQKITQRPVGGQDLALDAETDGIRDTLALGLRERARYRTQRIVERVRGRILGQSVEDRENLGNQHTRLRVAAGETLAHVRHGLIGPAHVVLGPQLPIVEVLRAQDRVGAGTCPGPGELQGHGPEGIDRQELRGVGEALHRQLAFAFEQIVGQLRLGRQTLTRQRGDSVEVAALERQRVGQELRRDVEPAARVEAHGRRPRHRARVE